MRIVNRRWGISRMKTSHMLKRFVTGLAAATAVFAAGAASAADLPAQVYTKAPPPVAVFDWTGFYIGGNIGWSHGRADVSALGLATASVTMNGIMGGGQIGYNFQTGPFVLGVEVDGQGTGQHADFAAGILTERDEMPWFFTARGRVGYAIAPQWLIYGTGGLAVADFKSTLTATGLGTATWEVSHVGWTAGAGVEVAVTRNWSVKGEYLHIDTGHFNTTLFGVVPVSARLTDDIARVGFNYRFF